VNWIIHKIWPKPVWLDYIFTNNVSVFPTNLGCSYYVLRRCSLNVCICIFCALPAIGASARRFPSSWLLLPLHPSSCFLPNLDVDWLTSREESGVGIRCFRCIKTSSKRFPILPLSSGLDESVICKASQIASPIYFGSHWLFVDRRSSSLFLLSFK
jgi:hypothetical protein